MALDNTVWGVAGPLDRLSKSHITRARKRTIRPTTTRNYWIVDGNQSLGDSYDEYEVRFDDEEGKYHCSCQDHSHGEYRHTCTHRTGVMLHREENGDPETWRMPEPRKPTPLGLRGPAAAEKTSRVSRSSEIVRDIAQKESSPAPTRLDQFTDAPAPSHPIFGEPAIPAQYEEFREGQWDAIKEVMEHLASGVKVIMLSAPTGSGKTIIAEATRRLKDWRPGQAIYMCSTKTLQDQVLSDFKDYARTIKGRANYETLVPDVMADTCTSSPADGPVCNRCPGASGREHWATGGVEGRSTEHCHWCHPTSACPYREAKAEARFSPLPVLNVAYFLNETSNEFKSVFHGRGLVIIDEADGLEGELMRHVEYVSTPGNRRWLGITSLPKKTVKDDWKRWLNEDVMPPLMRREARAKGVLDRARGGSSGDIDPALIKNMNRINNQIDSVVNVLNQMGGEHEWVLSGYKGKAMADAYLTFKPVRVAPMAHKALWNRGGQFILMSASFVSGEQTASDLGLADGEWAMVEMESTFPIERRPVFVEPVVEMTHKTKDTAWPLMIEAINEKIDAHPDVRILIHTKSYALTDAIFRASGNSRLMTYRSSRERESALEKFKRTPDAVMLAPSFERGVDLPHDLCRVIMVVKTPWPNRGDTQVQKRQRGRGGAQWYAVETIRSIIQMTGRGMRSAEDECVTYIMDRTFLGLWKEWKRLFPAWWKDALVLDRNDPKWKRANASKTP